MVMAGEGVPPSLIQYRSQGNGRPWRSGMWCDILVYIPRQRMPYTFCVLISTSGKWAGKNTLQEGTKMAFLK